MAKKEKMIKGISTSVLFDMSEPDRIFKEKGKEAYIAHMKEHADKPLPLGRGFKHLKKAFENPGFEEVVLCSKNSPITARRAIITMQNEGITPGRMFFTNGQSPAPFLEAYGIKHFYTANRKDAIDGNKAGVFSTYYDLAKNTKTNNPSEEIVPKTEVSDDNKIVKMRQLPEGIPELRTIFNGKMIGHHVYDLDGVVFDSESEDFFQDHNLEAYDDYEKKLRDVPMNAGPAYDLFKHYNDVNNRYVGDSKPYGISIVTARGNNAALRAIETLYQWDEDVSGSAHFLAGSPKQPILHVLSQMAQDKGQSIEFYDDQSKNVDMGTEAGILSGQVPDIRGSEDEPEPDN
ncbi:MAG: 5'-nucleotidase [Alphaproteobacteria bacterium]